MRLLIIDGDPRFRALLRHHVTCRWPHAACVEYDPAVRGTPAPEIRAAGFDAVLLGGADRLDWLEDLARRSGFAPVVYFSERREDAIARRASALGACAVFGRDKIEHQGLIDAIAAAGERQARAREAAAPDTHRFNGARIPGYRLVRRLAGGPVSQLYVAESELDPQLVAIKVAGAPEAASPEASPAGGPDGVFKRFLQEYELAGRIAGRRTVRMLDLGVSDGRTYLVMEYFPGGSLRQRMRLAMTSAEALRLAVEIAHALDAVHAAGVLHRDLKPANIMLREDGSLALIDFGMARRSTPELEEADPMLISGTPHYMSPEQGHGESIDARSDLYSLGVILYEMLTGRKPYAADNPMAIIYMHRKTPLPALPAPLAPLQPVLDRLLGKSPADRFESAAAAAAGLREALEASGAAGQHGESAGPGGVDVGREDGDAVAQGALRRKDAECAA